MGEREGRDKMECKWDDARRNFLGDNSEKNTIIISSLNV